MPRWVLDASALLAVMLDEPGGKVVGDAMWEGAVMSTVNLAEAAAKLRERGWRDDEVRDRIRAFSIEFLPFGAEAALESSALRPATAALGLGLGDRACLATAASLGIPALTADRAWLQVRAPGVEVRAIR